MVVAEPAPGALLVTDAQVFAVEPPVLAAGEVPGVGTQYDVRLTGVSPAPAPGTVVLASETAAVAGRVVSTRDESGVLVVTLALAPLYEVLSAYHLDLSIDLAPYAVKVVEGLPELRAGAGASSKVAPDTSPIQPFKALECTGSVGASLFKKTIDLGIENKLQLQIKDDKDAGNPPTYSKVALGGSLALTGTVEIGLNATLSATGTCLAQVTVDLPIFGWLSVLVMPGVRLGAGVELAGKVTVATATLGVSGKVGLAPEFGWECGPIPLACRGLTKVEPLSDLTPKIEAQSTSTSGMRIDVSGQFFVLVGLDLVFLKGLGGHFAIAEAKIGPKQSVNSLALEDAQAHEAGLRSNYDLVLLATLEPGSGLKAAIKKMIDDDAVGVTLKSELKVPLCESPRGTFTVDKTRAGLGKKVKLTVDLDPSTVNYYGLDYNVDSIHFRRLAEGGITYDEVPELTIPVRGSNQTHFEVEWTPGQADAGKNDFAAFVKTTLPILPDLEIADDSRKQVEVLAFCPAGALAAARPASLPADSCGGTLRHVRTEVFPPEGGGGTMTQTGTAQVELVKDEEASAPDVWLLRPVGTFTFEESGTIGDCTVTIAPTSGTWTLQPPFAPGPGAVMLYVDSEPNRYEGLISLSSATGDYLYFNQVWACPEGTSTNVVYFDDFALFRVGMDQNLEVGPDGQTLQGSYQVVDQQGRTSSYQWDLHLN